MRPRPKLAAFSLLVLATVHAWWGLKMLLGSELLLAGSQLVSVGGLVLAAVAVGQGSRAGLAVGMAIAAASTSVRLLAGLGAPGPFTGATAILTVGMAAIAWGAWRLDAGEGPAQALALRSGGLAMATAYATFLGLSIAFGGPSPGAIEFVARILAALTFAATVDAPSVFRERKAFAAEGASAAR